jgi:ketosteroid isomerase-like protein
MEGNAELVRKAYDAFNGRDFEAAAAMLHPEAEWHPYLGIVDGDLYRGREAILELWRSLDDGFGESLRIEPLEVVDCGDRVVAVVEGRATGSGSGAEVRQSWAQVFSFREGLVFRVQAFDDRAAAMEAAARGG